LATTSTQRAQALELLGVRPMMRLKDFAAHGIGPETLARLVREGIVVRPARGLYQLAVGSADARRALAEAAALVPKGIVCLVSALQFHGLTLLPSSIWTAIERTAWRPRIHYPPMRFVRFAGAALTEGIERHHIEGVAVAITDPGRTIVDRFRYRAR
jgi:predicted transcriptional regulator of viral defense system